MTSKLAPTVRHLLYGFGGDREARFRAFRSDHLLPLDCVAATVVTAWVAYTLQHLAGLRIPLQSKLVVIGHAIIWLAPYVVLLSSITAFKRLRNYIISSGHIMCAVVMCASCMFPPLAAAYSSALAGGWLWANRYAWVVLFVVLPMLTGLTPLYTELFSCAARVLQLLAGSACIASTYSIVGHGLVVEIVGSLLLDLAISLAADFRVRRMFLRNEAEEHPDHHAKQ